MNKSPGRWNPLLALALVLALATALLPGQGQQAAAAGPNLISNGGFESGITSWTVVSGDIDVVSGWQPSEGTRSLDLNGFFPGTISQSFATTPGAPYQLAFDLAGNPGNGGVVTVEVSVAGVTSSFTHNTAGHSNTNMGWTGKTLNFTATASSTTLQFKSLTTGPVCLAPNFAACGPALDNIRVMATNDPPTINVNVTAANTVYYVDWTAASPGAGTASGVINLPGGQSVNVTFQALNPNGTPSFYWGAQTGCGTNYWNPTAPYISTEVPTAPPNCELLQLSGGTSTIYKVTLSQPILDPIMPIVSLGAGGVPTTYDFDSPYTIVSQGVGFWGGCGTCLTQLPGDVLRGDEGHGTIKFLGSYNTFSWTVPTPETWHGFTFAIRTTATLGNTNVQEGQTATNSGTWGDPNAGDVVTLSASRGNIVKNADGTWNWSLLTTDGPAETGSVTVTATDSFGASASRTFQITVTNVAPTATLSAPATSGGSFTVALNGATDPSSADVSAGLEYAFDCGSGYGTFGAASSAACTVGTFGPVTVRGKVRDKDGGVSEYSTVVTIIDTTPPTISGVAAPAANANGWNNTDVTVTFTCADADSGIASCTAPVTVSAEGTTTVNGTAVDNAGNTASASVTVQVDKTAPTITATPSASGWSNTDVTVTFACSDSLSGVATCPAPVTVSAEGSTVVSGTATDNAGNSSTTSVTVKIDKTAPVLSCTATPNSIWPPNHKMVTVTVNVGVSDGGSGAAGFTLVSVTSSEPDNGLGDGDTANDIQGWAIGTADTTGQVRAERSGTGTGRVYTITYAGTDAAGNTGTCSVQITVPHDKGKS